MPGGNCSPSSTPHTLRALARATPGLSTEPRIDRVVCTPDQLGDARGGDEPDIVIAWRRDLKQEAPWAHKDVGPVIDSSRTAGVAQPVVELRPSSR